MCQVRFKQDHCRGVYLPLSIKGEEIPFPRYSQQIFLLCIGYPCTTLWVQNSLKIALSLTVFEIFTLFHFPLKSKMAAKSGKNSNFSPSHRTLLYYPVGQKFARNHSISYTFRDIHTFSFSAKIQDDRQK